MDTMITCRTPAAPLETSASAVATGRGAAAQSDFNDGRRWLGRQEISQAVGIGVSGSATRSEAPSERTARGPPSTNRRRAARTFSNTSTPALTFAMSDIVPAPTNSR